MDDAAYWAGWGRWGTWPAAPSCHLPRPSASLRGREEPANFRDPAITAAGCVTALSLHAHGHAALLVTRRSKNSPTCPLSRRAFEREHGPSLAPCGNQYACTWIWRTLMAMPAATAADSPATPLTTPLARGGTIGREVALPAAGTFSPTGVTCACVQSLRTHRSSLLHLSCTALHSFRYMCGVPAHRPAQYQHIDRGTAMISSDSSSLQARG